MAHTPRNVRELLKMIGGFASVAAAMGLSNHEVTRSWALRNVVPFKHWGPLQALARKRGVPLSRAKLLELQLNPAPDAPQPHKRRPRTKPSEPEAEAAA